MRQDQEWEVAVGTSSTNQAGKAPCDVLHSSVVCLVPVHNGRQWSIIWCFAQLL